MVKNNVPMANRMAGNPVLKHNAFSAQRFGEANVSIMGRPDFKRGVSESFRLIVRPTAQSHYSPEEFSGRRSKTVRPSTE